MTSNAYRSSMASQLVIAMLAHLRTDPDTTAASRSDAAERLQLELLTVPTPKMEAAWVGAELLGWPRAAAMLDQSGETSPHASPDVA